MSNAKDIFDMSLGLEMRETLLIPVHNKAQQESLRVGLSYNRRIFQESVDIDFEILISKQLKGDKVFIALTKVPKITMGLIISPDGTSRPQAIKKEHLVISAIEEELVTIDADERIRKAMEEDGKTPEEIATYFEELK